MTNKIIDKWFKDCMKGNAFWFRCRRTEADKLKEMLNKGAKENEH